MSKAAEKELGELHGMAAKAMKDSLSNSGIADGLLEKYAGELPEDVAQFLEELTAVSPAMLTVITRFLKDNEITADPESKDGEVSALERALQSRKRITDTPLEKYDA